MSCWWSLYISSTAIIKLNQPSQWFVQPNSMNSDWGRPLDPASAALKLTSEQRRFILLLRTSSPLDRALQKQERICRSNVCMVFIACCFWLTALPIFHLVAVKYGRKRPEESLCVGHQWLQQRQLCFSISHPCNLGTTCRLCESSDRYRHWNEHSSSTNFTDRHELWGALRTDTVVPHSP